MRKGVVLGKTNLKRLMKKMPVEDILCANFA